MDPDGGKGKESQAHDGYYKHVTVFLPIPCSRVHFTVKEAAQIIMLPLPYQNILWGASRHD